MAKPTLEEALISLHRYFLSASTFRSQYGKLLPSIITSPDAKLQAQIFLEEWYAKLQVVVDGWNIIKKQYSTFQSDSVIDGLLSGFTKKQHTAIKDHRDGTYHFRPKYYDDKRMDVFLHLDGMDLPKVHQAFSDFFLQMLKARREKEAANIGVQISVNSDCGMSKCS